MHPSNLNITGASEASSKWVGKTKNYSTCSKNWVGKRPFSIKIKQKSEWARTNPAPTPLHRKRNTYLFMEIVASFEITSRF